jgi:hypothetical protein
MRLSLCRDRKLLARLSVVGPDSCSLEHPEPSLLGALKRLSYGFASLFNSRSGLIESFAKLLKFGHEISLRASLVIWRHLLASSLKTGQCSALSFTLSLVALDCRNPLRGAQLHWRAR